VARRALADRELEQLRPLNRKAALATMGANYTRPGALR